MAVTAKAVPIQAVPASPSPVLMTRPETMGAAAMPMLKAAMFTAPPSVLVSPRMENTLALTGGGDGAFGRAQQHHERDRRPCAVRGDGEYDRDRGEGAHAGEQDGEGGAVGVASTDGQAGQRADSVESQHEGV